MRTTYSSEQYFKTLDALAERDWVYKLANKFSSYGVTNAQRMMDLERISERPQSDQKAEMELMLKQMSALTQQSQVEQQREINEQSHKHSPSGINDEIDVHEIKAFL